MQQTHLNPFDEEKTTDIYDGADGVVQPIQRHSENMAAKRQRNEMRVDAGF